MKPICVTKAFVKDAYQQSSLFTAWSYFNMQQPNVFSEAVAVSCKDNTRPVEEYLFVYHCGYVREVKV
jgi:hypothetical protein